MYSLFIINFYLFIGSTNGISTSSAVSLPVSTSPINSAQSSPTVSTSLTNSAQSSPTPSPPISGSSGPFGNKWLLLTFVVAAITLGLMAVIASLILVCICLCGRKRKREDEVDKSGQELIEGHYDVIEDGTGLKTDPQELVSYDSVADAFYPALPPPPTVHFIQSSLPPLSPLFSNYEEPIPTNGSKCNTIERCGNHGNTFSFNPYEDKFEFNEGPPLPPPRSHRRSSLPLIPPIPNADSANGDFDHIYTEVLEPSMLHGNQAPPPSDQKAFPYAPIYEASSNLLMKQLFHIPSQCLQILDELGHGRFGKIFLAGTVNVSLKDLKLNEDTNRSRSILVAMKRLKPEASPELREAFNQEIKFMSHLQHANVVRLLAVSLTGSPFIVIEYMENGDLHQFLHQLELQPNSATLSSNHISPVILLYITVQIASGMRYLANNRFVHRDLAARNILVGRDFVTKISDFGMSRSLYESSYYCVAGQLILPIRWMSTETYYGQFSVKSDSWSFGVTVWEVFTLCRSLPYSHLQDDEVITDAIKGKEREVLDKPKSCPCEVYSVLKRCFVHSPPVRADFEEIYSRLFVIYKKIVEEIR